MIDSAKTIKDLESVINVLNPTKDKDYPQKKNPDGDNVACLKSSDCENEGICNKNYECECKEGYMGEKCGIIKKNLELIKEITNKLLKKMGTLIAGTEKLDEKSMKMIEKATEQKETCDTNCVDLTLKILENNKLEIPNEETKQIYKNEVISNAGKAINNNKKTNRAESIKQGERIVALNKKVNKESAKNLKKGESINAKSKAVETKISNADLNNEDSSDLVQTNNVGVKKKEDFNNVIKDKNKGKDNVKVASNVYAKEANPYISKDPVEDYFLNSDVASFSFFGESGDDLEISSPVKKLADFTFKVLNNNFFTKPKCNTFTGGFWNTRGVSTGKDGSCNTLHFSAFAMISLRKINKENKMISLGNPGFVFLIVSFLLLLLTLIPFIIISYKRSKTFRHFVKSKTKEVKLDETGQEKKRNSVEIIEAELHSNDIFDLPTPKLQSNETIKFNPFKIYPIASIYFTKNIYMRIQQISLLIIWINIHITVHTSVFALNGLKVNI